MLKEVRCAEAQYGIEFYLHKMELLQACFALKQFFAKLLCASLVVGASQIGCWVACRFSLPDQMGMAPGCHRRLHRKYSEGRHKIIIVFKTELWLQLRTIAKITTQHWKSFWSCLHTISFVWSGNWIAIIFTAPGNSPALRIASGSLFHLIVFLLGRH